MIYRKTGTTIRWENGVLIHVAEAGVAVEDGERFECRPEKRSERDDAGPDVQPIRDTAAAIAATVPPGIAIERLILTEGRARHSYGERTWEEQARRLHLSLVRERWRVLLDQGDFDTGNLARVADALLRMGEARPAPPRLRIAPAVTAALIPSLIALAPPNVQVVQTAGGLDGRGDPIEEARGDWPNWYRPSYRIRPRRMALNVRLECPVTEIERDRPEAIALLAPVEGLSLHALIDDGESAFPAYVPLVRIDAVANERHWFPYGGGSFGAEMML